MGFWVFLMKLHGKVIEVPRVEKSKMMTGFRETNHDIRMPEDLREQLEERLDDSTLPWDAALWMESAAFAACASRLGARCTLQSLGWSYSVWCFWSPSSVSMFRFNPR